MVTDSLFISTKQNSQALNKDQSTILTVVVITKNRPVQVKQLVTSILEANLSSLSLLLIDDSDPHNYEQNQAFLESLSIPIQHLSSNQAIKLVESRLEQTILDKEKMNFVKNCTGVDPPFQGFVERLFKWNHCQEPDTSVLHFSPYSIARNLGIYCALRYFDPSIIFFLDDDCKIQSPTTLAAHINLIGSKLDQRTIIAVSGIYKELEKIQERTRTVTFMISIFRGMDAFLEKSLKLGNTCLQVSPPHMLGGVLILGKSAFTNLPFDPYVPRGEDHMYALDLATVIGHDRIFVRDSSLIVDHEGVASNEKRELNIVRDIFRFLYCQAKTGRSFIPFFLIRWVIASIVDSLFYAHSFGKCKRELCTLLYIGQKYAKEKGNIFRDNISAWRSFVRQINPIESRRI